MPELRPRVASYGHRTRQRTGSSPTSFDGWPVDPSGSGKVAVRVSPRLRWRTDARSRPQ